MQALLAVLLLALLAGCGSLEIRSGEGGPFGLATHARVPADLQARLAQAPDCCDSLSGLPFRNLSEAGASRLEIGPASPAFTFESGKSFFAAYRIGDLPRPFSLEIASYRTAEPGSLGKLLPDFRQLVFAPVALLFDDKFRLARRLDPSPAAGGCASNPWEPVYALQGTIGESPAQAAYLVVLTSREMLAREGDKICGIVRHGLSPVGDLSLRITTIEFSDGPMGLESPAKWFPLRRDVGMFAGIFDDPGLLVLGDSGIHFLERKGDRFAEGLNLPYSRIFAAKAVGTGHQQAHYLSLGFLDQGRASYHTFQLEHQPPRPVVSAQEMAGRLAARIRPGQHKEKIAFALAEAAVPVEFEIPGQGAISRIGDAAVAAGMVTALPCGICQAGVCTPEILASCAALFSVGAVIGGIAGTGKELVLKLLGEGARDGPEISGALGRSFKPRLEAGGGKAFNTAALRQCIADELGRRENARWEEQGREGTIGLLPDGAPLGGDGPGFPAALKGEGYSHGAEASLSRIALVAEAKDGISLDTPASLRLEGRLRVVRSPAAEAVPSRVSWQSPAYRLGDWIAPDSRLAADVLGEGCRQMAKRFVEAGRKAWSEY